MKKTNCPNCGANLFFKTTYSTKCSYCNTVMQSVKYKSFTRPDRYHADNNSASSGVSATWCICITLVIISIFVIFGIR